MKKLLLVLPLTLFYVACVSSQETENVRALKQAAAKPAHNEAQIAEDAANACSVEEPFKSELSETTWVPTSLINQGDSAMPNGKEEGEFVYLRFDKDLKINGMSGNNLFGGTVVIGKNGSFRALNLLSTRRMGPYGEYEYKFLQALHKSDSIRLSSDGKTMKLLSGDVVQLAFKKIPHIQDK